MWQQVFAPIILLIVGGVIGGFITSRYQRRHFFFQKKVEAYQKLRTEFGVLVPRIVDTHHAHHRNQSNNKTDNAQFRSQIDLAYEPIERLASDAGFCTSDDVKEDILKVIFNMKTALRDENKEVQPWQVSVYFIYQHRDLLEILELDGKYDNWYSRRLYRFRQKQKSKRSYKKFLEEKKRQPSLTS